MSVSADIVNRCVMT